MNYSVSELGGFTGSALMDYGKEAVKKREINKALKESGYDTDSEGNPVTDDPLNGIEMALAGLYESVCGSFSRLKDGLSYIGEHLYNVGRGLFYDDGLVWESNDERIERILHPGESGSEYASAAKDEGFYGDFNPQAAYSKDGLTDAEKLKIAAEVSDPAKGGQCLNPTRGGDPYNTNGKNVSQGVNGMIESAMLDLNGETVSSEYQARLKDMEKSAGALKDMMSSKSYSNAQKQSAMGSYIADNKVTLLQKAIADEFERTGGDLTAMAKLSGNAICFVYSSWEYGQSKGLEKRSFEDFFSQELKKGNIGGVYLLDSKDFTKINSKAGSYDMYFGVGGGKWMSDYGMTTNVDGASLGGKNANGKYVSSTGAEYAKEQFKNLTDSDWTKLNQSGVTFAQFNIETRDGREGERPNHWVLGVKKNGIWYNYDHNSKKRDVFDKSKVYRMRY